MKRPLITLKNEQLIQEWANLHYGGNFTLAANKLIEAAFKHNDAKHDELSELKAINKTLSRMDSEGMPPEREI